MTARDNVIEPLTAESLAALREMLPHVHVTGRCLEALLNEIDAHRLRTSQEWVDVRDGLPELRGHYLFSCGTETKCLWFQRGDDQEEMIRAHRATHWKPIPPPKGEAP